MCCVFAWSDARTQTSTLTAGGGATEAADTAGPSPEAQATVSKRLLVGGAVTLGLLAFAMVPTKELRLKPQKPLYFYVVQLLSAQVSAGGAAAVGCKCVELSHSVAGYSSSG
jgi:hypothetical protein